MSRPPYVRPPIAGKRKSDGPIAEFARRQDGVVSRRQLRAAGYTRHDIDGRLAANRLFVIHRGVYAVGHRKLTQRGKWWAALLAAGDDAVLSHESAAALWQLRDKEGAIEVTAPSQRRRRRGVRMHHSPLPSTDITIRNGIPTTTVIRTLIDLAQILPPEALENAIRQAEYHRLTSPTSLVESLSSRKRRPGVKALREALGKADLGQGPTRKGLERRFRRFLREHDLPRPKFNVPMRVNGRDIEVDCLWRDKRVIVELDGAAAHMTTDAFHRDRARDQELVAAGWRVVRITWWQLVNEPDRIAETLWRLLR